MSRILEGLGYEIGAQEAGGDVSERRKKGLTVQDALTDFQKQHPHIPEQEYGSRTGAITLWYLTEAGFALKKDEDYPVTPGARKP